MNIRRMRCFTKIKIMGCFARKNVLHSKMKKLLKEENAAADILEGLLGGNDDSITMV